MNKDNRPFTNLFGLIVFRILVLCATQPLHADWQSYSTYQRLQAKQNRDSQNARQAGFDADQKKKVDDAAVTGALQAGDVKAASEASKPTQNAAPSNVNPTQQPKGPIIGAQRTSNSTSQKSTPFLPDLNPDLKKPEEKALDEKFNQKLNDLQGQAASTPATPAAAAPTSTPAAPTLLTSTPTAPSTTAAPANQPVANTPPASSIPTPPPLPAWSKAKQPDVVEKQSKMNPFKDLDLSKEEKSSLKQTGMAIPITGALSGIMALIAMQSDGDPQQTQARPMNHAMKLQMMSQQMQDEYNDDDPAAATAAINPADYQGKSTEDQRSVLQSAGGYMQWSGPPPAE